MNSEELDIVSPLDPHYLDEVRKLGNSMRDKYYDQHKACPECGSTRNCQSYVGYIMDLRNPEEYNDKNRAKCNDCNWVGTVHDLVKAKKYSLIGIRYDYTPNSYTGTSETTTERTVVATFDSKEMAEAYVKKACLKKAKNPTWSSPLSFKAKSLLGTYSYAEIECDDSNDEPVHNPIL